MTPEQTFDLLMLAAAFDQRTVGKGDAAAWHAVAVTGGWTWPTARRAMLEHYTHRRERIMPADITQRIAAVRDELWQRFQLPCPPADLIDNPQAYTAWCRDKAREFIEAGLDAWATGSRHHPDDPPPAIHAA